jgi:hypothetical protein
MAHPFLIASRTELRDEGVTTQLVRDGDWREPFEVVLDENTADDLRAARVAGFPIELAIVLGLERRLVLLDAHECGLDRRLAEAAFDAAADRDRCVLPGPGATDARYVLALQRLQGRVRGPELRAGVAEVLLPCRLHARARLVDISDCPVSVPALQQARAWELAAACDGRLMGEWAKQQLLLGLRYRS